MIYLLALVAFFFFLYMYSKRKENNKQTGMDIIIPFTERYSTEVTENEHEKRFEEDDINI